MKTKEESVEKLEHMRHSLAHLLGAAVKEIWGDDVKLTLGPAIDNGFYYDFEFPADRRVSEEDLPKIEAKMKELLPTWSSFERKEVKKDEAEAIFRGNPFKEELITEIAAKGEPITLYTSGKFTDLCRGGHVEDMKSIDSHSFILDRVAGAYWRGDEKNPMLTRIYGLAFATKKELDAYLAMREEAAKRDHKVLGKKLSLFTFSPEVGSGLPLYMPRGNMIREELLKYITEIKKAHGYQFVWTPHLAKKALYIRSGHLGKYDAMLPPIETDGEEFILKPMNCPHHFQIYNAEPRTYKDLPFRIAENATDYRNEKSGELNGLFRVRSLTQDDTHHVIRHDQIASEIDMILDITRTIYDVFGFKNFHVEISTRDKEDKKKYFGTDEMWNDAENALINAAKRWGADYKIVEGEAAFYGPKIDIRVEDALGRDWQLTTVQLDYNQPENFDMTYIDETGKKVRPAVIHAAILGSVDRFMGVIIEHFGGAFPSWLAPTQVAILPVSEKILKYAQTLCETLRSKNIRTELNDPNESLGKRIRAAEMMKIPYILVVGEKEETEGMVSVRSRKDGKSSEPKDATETVMKTERFIEKIEREIREKTR